MALADVCKAAITSPTLSEAIQSCRCPESSFAEQKQGRGFPRPCFVETTSRFELLFAYLGIIREVQVVRSGAIEVDPTLDHIAVT